MVFAGVGGGAHLSVLFIPISPLNVLFLPRTTCLVKDTHNIFVRSRLSVTVV